MAQVNYFVCDRCDEQIETRGKWGVYKAKTEHRFSRIYGWTAQRDFELCEKCTCELEDFFGIHKLGG